MPQNEFCGYENPAFQAKNTFEYRNPSQWKPSIHWRAFAWKAITFITAGRWPADEDTTTICCLKGRTLAVVQMNIHTGKKRTNKTKIRSLKFLFLYFPFLYFLLILNYPLSIIHYIITPPRLWRYPSYLKRGVVSGSRHLNCPFKIRGQGPCRGYDIPPLPTSSFLSW